MKYSVLIVALLPNLLFLGACSSESSEAQDVERIDQEGTCENPNTSFAKDFSAAMCCARNVDDTTLTHCDFTQVEQEVVNRAYCAGDVSPSIVRRSVLRPCATSECATTINGDRARTFSSA